MAPGRGSAGHLDATDGRDVVYCHNCEHEWYQDQHPDATACPVCGGEFIEIVDADNDPRHMDEDELPDLEPEGHDPRSVYNRLRRRRDSGADPDEADIEEEEFHIPGGFYASRSIYPRPARSGNGQRPRPNPADGDDIIRRFTQMLGDIGGPTIGRSGPDVLFQEERRGPHVIHRTYQGPGISGEMSSITITSGPTRLRDASRHGFGQPNEDPFQRIFGELLGHIAPPPMQPHAPFGRAPPERNNEQEGNAAGQPRDLSPFLTQILGQILNPHGVHGDVVYTQEALDRIMTDLMENNPLSHAPAPASQNSIENLPKKPLDAEMLGDDSKGECTICIDEVNVGDEVVQLPCKHWFHNECASLWLKQHNSCPVCRAPIDGEAAGRPRTGGDNAAEPPSAAGVTSSARPTTSERRRTNTQQRGEARLESIRNLASSSPTRDRYRDRNRYRDRARDRSPSTSDTDRNRDNRGGSGSGPFSWIRNQFNGR
ncbi:hypothetical protein F5Y16DRAFT_2620 [Xylariaceae sp. FL0255]|nr:hypothetical protein F5Y16DRAFT_2620 [Xylariaceae sp. FL0255]